MSHLVAFYAVTQIVGRQVVNNVSSFRWRRSRWWWDVWRPRSEDAGKGKGRQARIGGVAQLVSSAWRPERGMRCQHQLTAAPKSTPLPASFTSCTAREKRQSLVKLWMEWVVWLCQWSYSRHPTGASGRTPADQNNTPTTAGADSRYQQALHGSSNGGWRNPSFDPFLPEKLSSECFPFGHFSLTTIEY